jgi:hypothetical protein
MEKPLINATYRLEKFNGKGGWTFARIPKKINSTTPPFGWLKVKGRIDNFEIKKYHLMPMGDGTLMLPVKAEIRKKIKKTTGDLVHIVLYPDHDPLEVPEELLLCLKDEPQALLFFNSLSQSEQKYYIQWICNAKKEETKVSRLAKTVNRLLQGKKMYDTEPSNK